MESVISKVRHAFVAEGCHSKQRSSPFLDGPVPCSRCLVAATPKTASGVLNLPVAIASCSFSFQCLAIASARGSSGFGALIRAWILHMRRPRGQEVRQTPGEHNKYPRKCSMCPSPRQPPELSILLSDQQLLFACCQQLSNARQPIPHIPSQQPQPTPHLNKTVRICSAGLHLSLRISRQMRPSLSTFGW